MIEIETLSEEDIDQLKKYFLENRIIKLKDILQPIEEYFWKFDLRKSICRGDKEKCYKDKRKFSFHHTIKFYTR